MDHPAATHRLSIGVPATVEHASSSSSQTASERAKWVAETTQNFITFMDALKLKLRAKDQLHPLLSDLMRSYSRSGSDQVSRDADGNQVRAKLLNWLITLNQMKASDEIDEDQARQVRTPTPTPPFALLHTHTLPSPLPHRCSSMSKALTTPSSAPSKTGNTHTLKTSCTFTLSVSPMK